MEEIHCPPGYGCRSLPFLPASLGLAGDANVLAASHLRYLEMLITPREVLHQQFKNLKEKQLTPVVFFISKPQPLHITNSEPGV